MTEIFDFLNSLNPNLGAVYSCNGLVLLTDKEYSFRLEQIRKLQQKVNQLETTWNELKEWLRACLEENNKTRLYDNNSYQAGEINTLENVIDKIQELERSKD